MEIARKAGLRRAIAGVLWKLLSSPVERALRLLVVFVAAPALGATAFGTYQYASTVTAMLAAGTELGIGTWTTRSLAREQGRAGAVMATGLWLRAAATLPYVVLVVGVSATQEAGDARLAMLVFGIAALANAFVDYAGAIFRGREDFRQEAIVNSVRAFAAAVCALGGLWMWRSLLGLALGMTFGTALGAAWGLAFLRARYGHLPGAPDDVRPPSRAVARAVLIESIPLWLSGLLAMLYFRSDIVIVRAFSGDAEVGAYAAGYRIFEATLMLPSAVTAVAFPRLARDKDPGRRLTSLEAQLVALLLLLGLVVAAVLLLADDRIVRLLLGNTFDRSIASLKVLCFTVPVMFVSFALCTFVITRGRERAFAKVLGAMLVLNVGLNLALVPRLGGVGAAWSTLLTELALVAGCAAILALGGGGGVKAEGPRMGEA